MLQCTRGLKMEHGVLPSSCQELLLKKDLFEEYLARTKFPLSSFSFITLFGWQGFFEFDFKMINDNLCIFAQNQMGCFLYLPPLGDKVKAETIEQCFQMMVDVNGKKGVTRIENVPEGMLSFFPNDQYVFSLKGYEYCYRREDIAHLRGNAYKSKRSSYNQFIKTNIYKYAPYEKSMEGECLSLYESWARNRALVYEDDIYRQMLDENKIVHQLTLQYYKELDIIGRVVLVNNKVRAYTAGFNINENFFCILFEIADLDIKGLPVFIFSQFCQDQSLQQYEFINVMDDFELANIKKTKISFHPHKLLASYIIKKRF